MASGAATLGVYRQNNLDVWDGRSGLSHSLPVIMSAAHKLVNASAWTAARIAYNGH